MILLDSQVVLWMISDNPRLGPSARDRIVGAAVVYASAASIWELTIKSMLGTLVIPPGLDGLLQEQGMVSLPVTAQHAAAIREFPELLQHDPFDRLLVAQAHSERLDLVTADRVLLGNDYTFVVDATT